jgi:hypothetical protein
VRLRKILKKVGELLKEKLDKSTKSKSDFIEIEPGNFSNQIKIFPESQWMLKAHLSSGNPSPIKRLSTSLLLLTVFSNSLFFKTIA